MSIGMKVYQKRAMRTSPRDGHDKIYNGILGLIGETGELVDILKKYKFQSGMDAQLPKLQIAEKLGDVLWYLAELADGMEVDLIDIAGDDFSIIERKMRRKSLRKPPLDNAILELSDRAARIRRSVKRHNISDTHAHMRAMLKLIAHVARFTGYSITGIAEMNINKLQKRYPKGFDPEISKGRYE